MVLLDIVADREGHIIAEGLVIGDAAADLAGGDLEQRGIHVMDLGADAGQFLFQVLQVRLLARTAHDSHPVRSEDGA